MMERLARNRAATTGSDTLLIISNARCGVKGAGNAKGKFVLNFPFGLTLLSAATIIRRSNRQGVCFA